jgi:ribosomal protein L13E
MRDAAVGGESNVTETKAYRGVGAGELEVTGEHEPGARPVGSTVDRRHDG